MNQDLFQAEALARALHKRYCELADAKAAAFTEWKVSVDAYELMRNQLFEELTSRKLGEPLPSWLDTYWRGGKL